MLVLTRNVREKVMIGDDIVVTILAMKGRQVRLGIDAPAQLPVHRQEIYELNKEMERGNDAKGSD